MDGPESEGEIAADLCVRKKRELWRDQHRNGAPKRTRRYLREKGELKAEGSRGGDAS
jgi:hypothetical protein